MYRHTAACNKVYSVTVLAAIIGEQKAREVQGSVSSERDPVLVFQHPDIIWLISARLSVSHQGHQSWTEHCRQQATLSCPVLSSVSSQSDTELSLRYFCPNCCLWRGCKSGHICQPRVWSGDVLQRLPVCRSINCLYSRACPGVQLSSSRPWPMLCIPRQPQ